MTRHRDHSVTPGRAADKRATTIVDGVEVLVDDLPTRDVALRARSRITDLEIDHAKLDERVMVVQRDVADIKVDAVEAREKRQDMRRVVDGISVQVGQILASSGRSTERKHKIIDAVALLILGALVGVATRGIKC